MSKSATDVMQEVIVAAVLDSIAALKAAAKGLPNTMVRDINAVHANTTFGDLPKELQDAISANVRSAFTRLLKEGYAVAPRDAAQRPDTRGRPDNRARTDNRSRSDRTSPGGPRRDREPGGKRPGGRRPDGKPGGGPRRGGPSKPRG